MQEQFTVIHYHQMKYKYLSELETEVRSDLNSKEKQEERQLDVKLKKTNVLIKAKGNEIGGL